MSAPAVIAVLIIPILTAVVFHEIAHGWVAKLHGDDTATRLGRLSLNPIKHIDLIGTIVVPTFLYFSVGFVFGWAKPVPVDIQKLNSPRRDMILVALAGPMSNFAMAILWGLVAYLSLGGVTSESLSMPAFIALVATAGIYFNIILGVFNLVPIPPLDGGRVLLGLLPQQIANKIAGYEIIALAVVALLIGMGWLWPLIGPIIYNVLLLYIDILRLPQAEFSAALGILFN